MSTTPEDYARVRALADDLIASCDGGLRHVDEIEALTLEECRILDGMAFECDSCNQWSSIHDKPGDVMVCVDCAPERD